MFISKHTFSTTLVNERYREWYDQYEHTDEIDTFSFQKDIQNADWYYLTQCNAQLQRYKSTNVINRSRCCSSFWSIHVIDKIQKYKKRVQSVIHLFVVTQIWFGSDDDDRQACMGGHDFLMSSSTHVIQLKVKRAAIVGNNVKHLTELHK